jgi:hypothetical protein
MTYILSRDKWMQYSFCYIRKIGFSLHVLKKGIGWKQELNVQALIFLRNPLSLSGSTDFRKMLWLDSGNLSLIFLHTYTVLNINLVEHLVSTIDDNALRDSKSNAFVAIFPKFSDVIYNKAMLWPFRFPWNTISWSLLFFSKTVWQCYFVVLYYLNFVLCFSTTMQGFWL